MDRSKTHVVLVVDTVVQKAVTGTAEIFLLLDGMRAAGLSKYPLFQRWRGFAEFMVCS
jgi:hypothetical protein